jgi:hypothetical protein
MTSLERAVALEQSGTNDHVKAIGRQIKVWIEGVTATSMSKSEMSIILPPTLAGIRTTKLTSLFLILTTPKNHN